ncbi:sulfotransferase [Adhaeribacter soli]|uniref:Sulfotransferase n=1 Tax=Adhaeribacter soli TaxID=2607655 RepID=A0A5N1J2T4_9BACT|nr:sulfotransferase [Adhaeribacter soli]KAA9340832.1 sulfotransferase [Adhaeribacter soli]
MTEFFITGTYRSGTTLLDKILHNHPKASCLSQPTPALFLETKKAFLQNQGLHIPYQVHNDYFREKSYRPATFTRFLEDFHFRKDLLEQVNAGNLAFHARSQGYTSVLPLTFNPELTFADFYRQVLMKAKNGATASGSKEVICEEFLPYLLHHKIKCLLILRDPRDVIASTYFGKGQEFVGSPRPFLWIIRNWRKSVAFALAFLDESDLLVLRYEDLIRQPVEMLAALSGHLTLDQFPADFLQKPLLHQSGQIWKSNSSHESASVLSPDSAGSYRKVLPKDLQNFIETVCFPEMKVLGYDPEISAPDFDLIRNFKEPFPITRPGIDALFSEREEEKNAEIKRLALWQNPEQASTALQQEYFIFEKAHRLLRERRELSFL